MLKSQNLNGIPHDLVKSYFATDKYCVCGYMADWLFYAAKHLNIIEITIDIINKTYIPKELNFHPFTYELNFLKNIIERSLLNNGFEKNFIKEAKIKIVLIPELKELICLAWLIDINDFKYESECITEYSSEKEFNPFTIEKRNNLY